MNTHYESRATRHVYTESDKVWLWNPTRKQGLSPKLQTHWEGPYTVRKRLSDVVVRIQRTAGSKAKVVHYDRLAPYYGNL